MKFWQGRTNWRSSLSKRKRLRRTGVTSPPLSTPSIDRYLNTHLKSNLAHFYEDGKPAERVNFMSLGLLATSSLPRDASSEGARRGGLRLQPARTARRLIAFSLSLACLFMVVTHSPSSIPSLFLCAGESRLAAHRLLHIPLWARTCLAWS